MASKCCRDKAVVVAVYTEKPHHHHYHHFYGKRIDGKRDRRYNRRAELLDYSRQLRAPTQSTASPKVLADETRNKKISSPPTCFDKWGDVFTKFLESLKPQKITKDNEKKNHNKSLVKSLKKKVSFFSNLLATLRKRRR